MEAFWNNLTSSLDFMMMIRLIISAVFGGIVGMERGSGDRPAGFRTHILVCAGSTLIMLVSMYGFDGFNTVPLVMPGYRDSARIAAQVVSGIGFLGAGTILHEGVTVRGLTTAASLWMVSAIGLAVGAGMYLVSFAATAITMITLVTFHNWEKRFAGTNRAERRYLRIVAVNKPGTITEVTSYLAENGVKVKTLNVKTASNKNQLVLEIYIKVDKEMDANTIIGSIQDLPGVISLENVN